MNKVLSAYQNLLLEPGADLNTIEKHYKFMTRGLHPDQHSSPEHKARAEATMKTLNAAVDTLRKHFKTDHKQDGPCDCRPSVAAGASSQASDPNESEQTDPDKAKQEEEFAARRNEERKSAQQNSPQQPSEEEIRTAFTKTANDYARKCADKENRIKASIAAFIALIALYAGAYWKTNLKSVSPPRLTPSNSSSKKTINLIDEAANKAFVVEDAKNIFAHARRDPKKDLVERLSKGQLKGTLEPSSNPVLSQDIKDLESFKAKAAELGVQNNINNQSFTNSGSLFSPGSPYKQPVNPPTISPARQLFSNEQVNEVDAGIRAFGDESYEDALSHFDRALQINPKSAVTLVNRGSTYVALGRYELAIRDYNEAIRLEPGYAKAYQARGNAYRKMNNMDQALSDLNSSVRLNPKFGLAYYTRGILKAEVKDFRGAIDDYGSAIALNPNDTDARYMRAEAKINMNDQNGAILDLNKTLEINPDHVNASRLLYRLNQSSSQNGGTDPGDPVRTMELLDARNAANQGNLYPMQMYKKKYGSSY